MKKDVENKVFKLNKFKSNKGITLIVLVTMVLIIFILSSITFLMMSKNNSIINEALTSKEVAQKEDEREAIQQLIAYSIGSKKNNTNYYIGNPLIDKNEENINSWQIIVTVDGKTYGTGWNYIGKDTDVYDYGKTKYEWVANYYTGEVELLEEGKYTKSSYIDDV